MADAFDFLDDEKNWAKTDDTSEWSTGYAGPRPKPVQSWGDLASDSLRAAGAGALDLAGQVASTTSWFHEKTDDSPDDGPARGWGNLAAWLHDKASSLRENMSEGGRRVAGAKVFAGDGEDSVFDHPISSLAMGAANLAPIVATLGIFPEGLLGAAANGATLQIGQVVDQAMQFTNGKSDGELRKDSKAYDAYRNQGMSEGEARARLHTDMLDFRDLAAAAGVGVLTFGGPARLLKSGSAAGGTLARRALVGGSEGGVGMGLAAADADVSMQHAEMGAGKRDQFDPQRTIDAGIEGVGAGAIVGAIGGAIHKPKAEAEPKPTVEHTTDLGPDTAQTAALGAHGTEGSADAAAAPPAASDVPPEVRAAIESVQNPSADAAPAPITLPGSTPVPPAVADAAQRVQAPEPERVRRPTTEALDTGANTPEAPATLEAQRQKLVDGEVPAVMYPTGTASLPTPPGMKRIKTARGVFDYDPAKTSADAIRRASKEGRENDVLGLGPMSKDDVAAAAKATGEAPVAVVERAPDGTEVKGTLATPSTVDIQAPTIEANKTPGNTISVEAPDRVIAQRTEAAPDVAGPPLAPEAAPLPAPAPAPRAPRILPDVSPAGRAAEKEARAAGAELAARIRAENKAAETTDPVGRNRTAEERDARRRSNEAADGVVAAHPPTADEKGFLDRGATQPRDAILARARRMLAAAEEAGLKIPERVKDNVDSDMNHGASMVALMEAKALAGKKEPSKADFVRFTTRERIARSGDRETVVADRRAEGDARMKAQQKDVAHEADTHEAAPSRGEVAREIHRDSVWGPDPSEHILERIDASRRAEAVATGPASPSAGPKGEGGYLAGKAQAPKAVAKKGDELKAMRPKVDGKVSLGKRARGAEPAAKREPVLANRTYDPHADLERGHADFDRLKNKRTTIWGSGGATEPLHTMTAREALDTVRPEKMGGVPLLMPLLRRRLRELVGDIPVHLVDRDGMVELEGSHEAPAGYYDRADRHIVMRVDAPRAMQEHTILHESIHAATAEALDRSPELSTLVERIMSEVRAEAGGDVTREVSYAGSAKPLGEHYGMQDVHEFLAEALSNTVFQRKLSSIRISPELARDLGLPQWRKQSAWTGFVAFVRRALNLPADMHSALEAAVATFERATDPAPEAGAEPHSSVLRNADRSGDRDLDHMFRSTFTDALGRGTEGIRSSVATLVGNPIERLTTSVRALASEPETPSLLKKIGRYVATNDQYRQNVEHLFPGTGDENLVRRIFDGLERQGVLAQQLKERGDEITRAMARAQKVAPEAFRRFADLLNDATTVGVDPSAPIGRGRNAHLAFSKDNAFAAAKGKLAAHELPMSQWEAHDAHPDLVKRFDALVAEHPEFRDLMDETFSFFHEAQQDMARGHIENILRGIDAQGDLGARAVEIRDARPSEEWREAIAKEFGEPALGEILKAKQLAGGDGPYAPLMRHGDFVVLGRYAVKEPANAIGRHGDTWEFASRKEAYDFAKASGLHFSVDTAYYDRDTGKKTTQGDVTKTGEPEQRFAVTLQRDHVEFHDSRASAEAARKELAASGVLERISEALDRRRHEGLASELTSAGMQTILKRLEQQASYKEATPTQRAEMRKALTDAALAMKAGNRVQSRRLPRRRVAGASDDLVRNMHDYNQAQANYRAKLEHRPLIDAAIDEMRAFERDHQFEKGGAERSLAANEVESRARAADPNEYSGAWTDFTRRVGTLSYIDRMLRPSHLILHQTHLPMITAPIIAGRHGVGRTYGMMLRTWKAATRAYGAGGRDFVDAIADSLHKGVDYTRLMKESFAKDPDGARVGAMFDKLAEIGLIHPQGSLDGAEIVRNSPSRDRGAAMRAFDTALGKLDVTFRHLTNATEAINRYVGATMAYRLEFDRLTREGKRPAAAHDLAVEYARETLANTQGFYSATNAAPLFKNKWLKPFLQFRQFPQMMYHLLGRTAVRAFTGATREDKIQALKSLGLILASHSAMTGALGGLPLEAPMVVTNVAKGLGITDADWKDVEHAEYAWAVKTFGKDAAEVLMHGLGGKLGVDVHHRMGLNSFFTFGMPDSYDAKSVWGFLGQQAMGAPGGLVADAMQGISRMAGGDIVGGAAKAFPLQALRDVRTAWAGGSGSYAYTPAERATRLLGFTPSGEAKHYEAQREIKRARDAYEGERRKLTAAWTAAAPEGKAKAWAAIQRFNAGKPKEAQITMASLKAASRRASTGTEIEGVRLGKREQFIADEYRALH